MKDLRADILSSMRDRVRDARYIVRALASSDRQEGRTSSGGRTPVDPRDLLRNVAKLSDSAMRRAESIATSLSPFADPDAPALADPQAYFDGRPDAQALFHRDVLSLLSTILPAVALTNPLVHETRIALAYRVVKNHPAALATRAGPDSRDAEAVCALGAAIALELARAGAIILAPPVVGGLPKTQGELRSASFAYSVLGLAMAVSGLSGGTVPRATLTESVLVSAKARQGELTAALEAGDVSALSAIFTRMAPHLP